MSDTDSPKIGGQGADERFLTPPLLIIFVTVTIDLIGFGIVIPLLTFYAEEFRATPFDVGILMASYSLMQFIFAPIWGNLSDRFGRRPVLFITILGSAAGYLILGLASGLWMLYLGRILAGIMGGNLSTAQAYVADVTTVENRARGMGLFGMAFGLGFILGPALAGVLSKFGIAFPFYFAAALSLINAVVLYFILPEPKHASSHHERKKGRLKAILRAIGDKKFATIMGEYFLLVTAFSIMTTSFAYFTLFKFEYDAERTGYLLGFVGVLGVVIQGGIFGMLANKFGEARLIMAGSAILVASLFATPFVGAGSGGLTALLVVLGMITVGNSIANPSITSLASKVVGETEQGQALGILQSGASLARVIGPFVCGLLLDNAVGQVDDSTIRRTYWTAAAVMLAALLIAVHYWVSREDKRGRN